MPGRMPGCRNLVPSPEQYQAIEQQRADVEYDQRQRPRVPRELAVRHSPASLREQAEDEYGQREDKPDASRLDLPQDLQGASRGGRDAR